MILSVIFCFFSCLILSNIVYVIMKVQNILSIYVQKSVLIQPYSSKILSRYLLMVLSLLESPLIFSSLGIVSIGKSFYKYNDLNLIILILTYLSCIVIVSIKTVFICEKPIKNFFDSFSNHPKNEKLFSSKFIVSLSLFQTPLLFTLVLVWIHISNIKFAFENEILTTIKVLFSSALIIMFTIAAYGVLKGMSLVMEGFSFIGIYFPEILKKFTASNFYTTLGLIEAPIIFPFLINMLMISFFKNSVSGNYIEYIFPFLYLFFGYVVSFVSYNSGKISKKNILAISENENVVKEIFSLQFITQVLLDARIIYLFIVIFLLILKLKIF